MTPRPPRRIPRPPRPLRRLGDLARRGFAWWLDYVYVGFWQAHALLFPASNRRFLEDTDPAAAPVLLIPGIYETWQFLHPVAKRLHALGHPVHVVHGLGYNSGTIEAMAAVVAAHLRENDLRDVVIVAHSKGGLIGKTVMSATDEGHRVRSMVAINTPFSGSVYARFAPLRSIQEFSPRHAGLIRLAENLEINRSIVSIYGLFDPHIPGGSYLEGATNVQLDTMGHFRPIADHRLLAAVEESLPPRP